jgi:hypothetical protein
MAIYEVGTSNRMIGPKDNGDGSRQRTQLARYPTLPTNHWRAPDTSSTILVPGYKINNFSKNRFTAVAIKRFCIRVLATPWMYNTFLKFWKFPSFVPSREGKSPNHSFGGWKMEISGYRKLNRVVVWKNIDHGSRQRTQLVRCPTFLTKALEEAWYLLDYSRTRI